MSKTNLKYGNLPKLQKKIVLCLAKNGEMIMSETNRKLSGENTSTTRAFHELEKKEMIKKTGIAEYRGRQFSKYWLTSKGIGVALLNGANSESIKQNALSISKDKTLEDYLELRYLSPKIAEILDTALILNGTLSREEMVRHLFMGYSLLEEVEKQNLFDTIKKTEEFNDSLKQIKESMREFTKAIDKIQGLE